MNTTSTKPHFKYYLDGEFVDKPEPMFGLWMENANGFSDVCGETLLAAGLPLPLFPDYKTWRREVSEKRRCGRCWAVVRGLADLTQHSRTNHLSAPIHQPHKSTQGGSVMKSLTAIIASLLFLTSTASAWEFRDNPDRFPSIGLHVDNQKLDGDRAETIFNSIGQRLPYRNSDEREFTWRGGADVRLPVHRSITFTFMYERVETEWFYTRHNTLGGDLYEETRQLSGYNYQLGVRLYLNR